MINFDKMFIIFLWIVTMLAFFHSLGKHSFSKQLLKKIVDRYYLADRYSIVSMSLSRIQLPYNLYNIIWTNFKSRSFFHFESYIYWDRTVVPYWCALLTKVIIKQICFYQKNQWLVDYLLAPFYKCFRFFPNKFLGLF